MRLRAYKERIVVVDEDGNKKVRFVEPDPYMGYYLFHTRCDKNIEGAWADRMREWDSAKYEESCNKVWGRRVCDFDGLNPADVEKFLTLYFDKACRLVNVFCNKGYNGYWYYRFDYVET